MSNSYTPEEPIAAIATALAPSALALIRISGKNCIELLSKVFSRPKALTQAEGNTIVYGWIVDSVNPDQKQKIDEVLVSVFRAPKSYTGEEMAEISCHGGISPVTAIFSLLLKNGFRTALPGEFTFRAFINGKTDLTKSEAVKEIIDSKTDASRSLAAGRLSGNLYNEIQSIKEKIISTIASIEVELEYPEDEENFSDSFDSTLLLQAKNSLTELSKSWQSQKLYQDGARIILCGKTNAGKSSLFNALLKEERAIVSDIEGTTRDWIESWVSFDGIPARLFDTAGLRITDDVIEQRGVEMTKDLTQDADIIIYLVDSTKEESKDDIDFINSFNGKIPVIKVLNKIDVLQNNSKLDENSVKISAKTGLGISDLIKTVKGTLVQSTKSDRTQAGLGSERQKQAVDEALDSVNHALEVSCADFTMDAVVQDLEDALSFLSEITGETTPEDILGNIFANFCVGK
ncbi:MAG: tRNA uridine-5-carboxymethylaminomethyl(34) synthesis GTPase MnmE [Spirochaetaceae bacterium]|nr:tRNA uridine-5-carboxymethylaminomethyl(34) synthesis GTPase MnmE [Spirochaetaceae bacterium]